MSDSNCEEIVKKKCIWKIAKKFISNLMIVAGTKVSIIFNNYLELKDPEIFSRRNKNIELKFEKFEWV